jgi:HK97 gp10 family phage protein
MAEVVVINHFPKVANALHKALSQTVRKVALDLQASAASKAPVQTGFLRSSIYTVTSTDSTYGQAGSPPGDSYLLPEAAKSEDDLTAHVAVGANYGVYVELGTRHMAAQPYFYPAVEEAKASFQEALNAIEPKIKGLIEL